MAAIMEKISEKINSGKNYMIFTVGDSITWGLQYCNRDETYSAVLAKLFSEHMPEATVLRYDGIVGDSGFREHHPLDGFSKPVTVKNGTNGTLSLVKCGVGGDTVQRAIERSDDFIGKFITGEYPDMFLLMFGINDSLISDSSKYTDPEQFYKNYSHLCDMLEKENPNAEIVLMTPTYNDFGTDEKSTLDIYSDKVKELAAERCLKCIDLHKLWMDHLVIGGDNYGQGDWLSGKEGDTCHFSVTGAEAAADFIFSELNN